MLARIQRFVAWAERHHDAILWALVAVELVIGIAYAAVLGSELRYWDEREYMYLVSSLLEHHEYRFLDNLAFRPPLYPFVLAAARAVGAPVVALRVMNFGFLAGAMVLLDRIAREMSRPIAGTLAAGWVLLNPVMIYTAGTLYPQTLAGFLLLAVVWLVVREPARPLYLTGLVFSLLVLDVPSFAPLLALLVLWVWRFRKRSIVRVALELSAGAAPLLVVWTLRNYAVLGHWTFVATNSGINLLYGNNENATPNSGVNADVSRYISAASGLGELGRDHYYRQAAFAWIEANPASAVWLYFGKLLHYFSSNDRLATASETSAKQTLVATLAYVPLQATLVGRLILARWRALKPIELLLFALYACNAVLAAVFFTRVRLRVPVDFLVLPLLGALAASLADRRPGGYG